MKKEIFKKLSPAQQQVVNALMVHDCYIYKSEYYNHNKVMSKTPMEHDGIQYSCILQFPRPTFKVLVDRSIIVLSTDTQYDGMYILNPELL